ncbi:thioredoxin domain-containing protein [Streptomyces johnsoniae]|uniref:Thioredoxin domain-containing protein n=1 Tax=Streptomyces johnsoniae TaxID=3075532 RepID=A0ABU2SE48_9ACTN|nr:thioredoxin domain-containing protein [Streptomyces sp. DSM 41886]MDT0446941.1 thioredoxin domain-containing protein [Streptomyces sp. DSM 41886]
MNRLADSQSPYLLQHAANPVDWWPWGAEAMAEARRRDVPVLLSVGYASCHWCHVMAHESFEDEAVAAYLNARFLPVKVDREERPDVDSVYMDAVQAATGQGGWPMTVFMTADGEPFYFGTYFPREPHAGLPSFTQLLQGVHTAWTERRGEVAQVAARITADLAERRLSYDAPGPPGEAELAMAAAGLAGEFDEAHGGFGGAPKFPPSMALEFLLRHHVRTGSREALRIAAATCEAMARGGIYDQLGGGFARYAVDATWTVPHYEKMLYDNALLARVYTHLWRVTDEPLARRIALETADFLVRELRTDEGGFASALDADSEAPDGGGPAEGAFYTWTPEQLRAALGPADAELAAAVFGPGEEGTLRLPGAQAPEGLRARLLDARGARPRPERDDKIVAAWNGLAIAALAEAGACFGRDDLVAAATGAAELLAAVHLDADGRLVRTSRDGHAGPGAGVLEDYGDVAEGFLALYAVTGARAWLDRAGALLETVLTRFAGADGTLFDTADDAERLIRRPQDPTDGATPSGWSAATGALLSYAAYTGSGRHRAAAERALGVVTALGPQAPRFTGWGLAVAEAAVDGPREVAVVGARGDAAADALHRTALRAAAPGAVVARGEPDDADPPPLLAGRPLREGRAAAYVCRGFVCAAPVTDPESLAAQLA